MLHGQLGNRAFHHAPGKEDLPRFIDARAGNYRAAIGPQQHHAFMGQP